MLELNSETWSALYLSTLDLKSAIAGGKVKLAKGNERETLEAFNMFDRFVPAKNYTIPPSAE